jgi:hypothetical protein
MLTSLSCRSKRLVVPVFEQDVEIVAFDNNLKLLLENDLNYCYVIKVVSTVRLNNYYYVINRVCDYNQIETELLKVLLSNFCLTLAAFKCDRTSSIITW